MKFHSQAFIWPCLYHFMRTIILRWWKYLIYNQAAVKRKKIEYCIAVATDSLLSRNRALISLIQAILSARLSSFQVIDHRIT